MKFGYIGIDYKHADQDIRDRVSFTDNQKIDFLQKAGKAGIEQCFVLSTCNRSEVYFFCTGRDCTAAWRDSHLV